MKQLIYIALLVAPLSLLAQFTDDFSDGDFTNNPTWTGDTQDYQVTAGELQLFHTDGSGTAASGKTYLSSAVQIADSTNWEFFVRQDFSPSSSNYSRVYLSTDAADLLGPLNGYFVRMGGVSGAVDALELWRQDGTNETLLVSGTPGNLDGVTATRVRVERDNSGNWTLKADLSGGTTFVTEGTATDNTYTTGSYMGVWCTNTATRYDKIFFDDFLVDPIFMDVNPPVLVTAVSASATLVDLTFDEPLDITTAQSIANYSIDNGIGVPTSAILTTPTSVSLTVAALTSGTTYTVTVTGVADVNNNAIPVGTPETASFTYILVSLPNPGDILINEIFVDNNPAPVGIPNFDYVELYNASNNFLDLNGSTFSDAAVAEILPAYVMAPGEHLILCETANIADFTPFGKVLGINLPTLNVGSDSLTLADPSAKIIDMIEYDDDMYQDPVKEDGGWSLELINPAVSCLGYANWIASNDAAGGTPGTVNSVNNPIADITGPTLVDAKALNANTVILSFDESLDAINAAIAGNYSISPGVTVNSATLTTATTVSLSTSALSSQTTYTATVASGVTDCSGNAIGTPNTANFLYFIIGIAGPQDILITEIHADPTPQVGLPEFEYLELYNNSTEVFDLSDILVEGGSLPSKLFLPGQYIIVCDDNSDGFGAFGDTIAMTTFPALTNGGELVTISAVSSGLDIDKVDYDDGWYQDVTKDNGGWSLELIDFNLLCKGSGNWIASNHPTGGTPGSQNSVYQSTPDNTPIDLLSATPISNNEILFEFNDVLDTLLAVDIANYSGIPNVLLAVLQPGNQSVLLVTSVPLIDQTTYTVTVSNLTDCVGNSLGIDNASFTFLQTVPANRYDILINEFMADISPDPLGLPDIEYIELYNRTQGKTFNLQGMDLEGHSLPSYILQPGQYVVIHKPDTTFPAGIPTIAVPSFPTITDAGEDLILMDDNDNIIDAIEFDLTWYDDADKNDGGWALERGNPNRPCEQGTNWHVSVDISGGTPGAQNSKWSTDPDVTFPDLINVYPISNTLLELTFSEALDQSTASDPANYIVDNGIGMADSAILQPILFNTVLVYLPTPVITGTTYTITVDPQDCTGNDMGLFNSQQFALFELMNEGDLIINEILYNPLTGGKDFVEVYNNSDKVFSLEDLYVASRSESGNPANQKQMDVRRLIFPGEFFAFTEDRNITLGNYDTPNPNNVVTVADLPTFTDIEGDVILFTNGQIIDEFHYSRDYQNALLDNANGVSLERIAYNVPTQEPNNWHSAASHVGFATPAYQNSQYLDREQSTNVEVSLETETLSPDGDGYQDFLLINYNLSEPGYIASVKVFDAKGRFVKKISDSELLGTAGTLKWDGDNQNGEKARLGIYIIVGELFNPNGNISRFKETCVVAGRL